MIVETTGNFGLGDQSMRQEVDAFRPSIVQPSPFISARIGLGQINILVDNLPMNANDAGYADCYRECMLEVKDPVKATELANDSYEAEVVKAFKVEQSKLKKIEAEAKNKASAGSKRN